MGKRVWMTTEKVAEYVGFCKATIYEYVSARSIPFYKIGGQLRFDPDQIDEWIEKQRVPELTV